jgi:RNA polymerase sigma-70 factor, ECF subfamily
MAAEADTEELVVQHYEMLYRFAYGLTHNEADACDLTQQTFYIYAMKGAQLNDPRKVKSWLHTTLYREFLGGRRRIVRFPHQNLEDSEAELPASPARTGLPHDTQQALDALASLDETFQAPLVLFYLGDHAYADIAQILELPLGTVKSRLARGIEQLQRRLSDPVTRTGPKGPAPP